MPGCWGSTRRTVDRKPSTSPPPFVDEGLSHTQCHGASIGGIDQALWLDHSVGRMAHVARPLPPPS
ncbi:hypothetical protein N7462_001985 [Penicillium macrosclerotiorum]|uniref:uncharacterized protein n=1 Tax=Penicillium macrosclerotiorum TaxID=303699 RepID=UPI002547FEBA|nr:uncharacterized protein N7462_001985 [Penicillium macrosclerotiorum]KAJ5692562.1 hypothetical protein N7462_001985 [Penicillium macrosclerotiorum]